MLARDASGLSYLATDALGTPIATVNLDTGAVLGEQVRAPYGEGRYAVVAGPARRSAAACTAASGSRANAKTRAGSRPSTRGSTIRR
ncbi:MAG TPA: hypothetical protein VGR88_02720 [Ktedonobacterales bacterium]|nr:hypothetical protein [Ktedonobacterales bacterium]